jgi:hypothetical protein
MQPRAILNAKRLISCLIAPIALIACTGSFEGGNSSARLVFTVSTAGSLNCLNAAGTSTPVNIAVGLLITNSNLEQSSTFSNCQSIPTESIPYDLVTTPTGDQIIVSLPGKGRLEVRSNKKLDAPVKLQPESGPFCPTRLALSPDARRIAVLDDPDDSTARSLGCNNADNRPPRVLVFDLTTIATSSKPILTATGGTSGTFQSDRLNGPFALTLNDTQAFVVAPFNNYAIFKLNRDNDARVTPQTLNSLTDLRTLDNSLRLELTTIGSRLLLTFNSSKFGDAGGAYFINSDFSTEQVSLNGAPLKATNRAVWNKRPNDSLLAYLQPNQVVFQRLTGTTGSSKALPANSPIDAAFTIDGYAWVLESSAARRFDVTNLANVSNPSQIFLGNLGPRAIGTFLQQ